MNSAIAFAGLVLGIAAPGTKEEPKKKDADPPTIVGTWKLQKMTAFGMELPGKDLAFEFTADGKFIRRDARGGESVSNYTVDPQKTPSEMDWRMVRKGKEEQPIRGIYSVDGDTLTICFEDGFDSARPDKFEAPAGTKRMLWTLTRATKKN